MPTDHATRDPSARQVERKPLPELATEIDEIAAEWGEWGHPNKVHQPANPERWADVLELWSLELVADPDALQLMHLAGRLEALALSLLEGNVYGQRLRAASFELGAIARDRWTP